MKPYEPPLRDIRFVRNELLEFEDHYRRLGRAGDIPGELVDSVVEEAGRFATSVLAPLYRSADEEGCQWRDGEVFTPSGFTSAYRLYVENGWPGIDKPVELGGQGLPSSVGLLVSEIFGSANAAFCAYPGLSHGAIKTIQAHGTDEQKARFLPPLVAGRWTGTMCLTEAHCGSDLGLLRARASVDADGRLRLYGTKIFVSAGDHDLAENIVHIVLARFEDAPPGVKGISLFIVPKHVVGGGALRRNAVACGSIEHKMGLHGSATCTLHFDGAEAELLGPPNKGLACMFTFMNAARIATGQQGVVHAELGLQRSLGYACERLQMRAVPPRYPDKPADPIIVHPDVRRMLLFQRAIAEGGRALIAYASQLLDIAERAPDDDARHDAEELLAFLTPICKGFLTEVGCEAANLALQCYGGHGYIREWGLEQNVRDARISTLYEGTTGIQALDLLGRKVLGSDTRLLCRFTGKVLADLASRPGGQSAPHADELQRLVAEWLELTDALATSASRDAEEIGAASVDYLMYSGYMVLGWLWWRAATAATAALHGATKEEAFYRAKLTTARFYFSRVLTRNRALAMSIRAGAASLAMDEADGL